ncbi:type II toxin-antitoxin system RelE/ParE family toxin [Methylosinus sp. RM1]|uniref:type II toxin-antitoxin system RelE/ParE family toxin n=1 Tax=Methylosinus sp. RM1 TaxID=2583817 RepID=UPI001FEDCD2F|nr:type II toxin-antitoxin system RelE/ParE family toxin [Methylosinus sp. RM1]
MAGIYRAPRRCSSGAARKTLAICTVTPYINSMNLRTIKHRGLRRFIESDDPRELRPDLVNRTRNILAALVAATNMEGLQGPPGWRIHQLSGDRAGTWSISVSGNWRITFELDGGEITNLDLEDYH